MSKLTNILIAAGVAGIAGIAAGILLAPESGKRTRKKLTRQARRVNDNLESFTYAGKEVFKDVKDSISDLKYNASHAFERLGRR